MLLLKIGYIEKSDLLRQMPKYVNQRKQWKDILCLFYSENNGAPGLILRPSTPVTSDSEIEKAGGAASREEQTSWRWGELPSPHQAVIASQVRQLFREEKSTDLI